jgi:dihydroorotate dehydrogenase
MKAQLSDGVTTIKTIFNTARCHVDLLQVGTAFGEKPTYLIAITQHVTHNFEGGKILEILNFIPLKPPQQQEHTPVRQA